MSYRLERSRRRGSAAYVDYADKKFDLAVKTTIETCGIGQPRDTERIRTESFGPVA